MTVGRPACFIDRDGTLIEEVGYVNHPSRVRLLPRSAEAVRRLQDAGVAAVVVTNQAAIARGYLPAELVDAVNREIIEQLEREDARLDGVYVCPHHPSEGRGPLRVACECRKPRPGLMLRAARDLGLDLSASVVVGDKPSDVQAGHAAGARGVLVLTGYGRGEWELRRHLFPEQPDLVAADLLDAVEWFLGGSAA